MTMITHVACDIARKAQRGLRRGASVFRALAAASLWSLAAVTAHAATLVQSAAPSTTAPADEQFAVHGQATFVEQATDGFRAPYAGANSLSPHIGRETTDATLFLGARLWSGAELWITPEIDQGFGLDNTAGAAGFPSGEAYKTGRRKPYLRWQRIFLRQTIDLGGTAHRTHASAMQLAGTTTANRLVFTVGKFSVTDLFDANRYAHDPRGDFLNWSLLDTGTFDYAADAWGYTVGAAAEWYQGAWVLRGGAFDLSTVPNSAHLDPGGHEFEMVAELERRDEVLGHPGSVRVTAFDNRGRMGLLNSAVQIAESTGAPPDISVVRQYRSRLGVSINLEQSLAADLGFYLRAGRAAGNVETYEFTDIDRSVALGISLAGDRWHRPADTLGIGAVENGISAARTRYLAAGGLGLLVGDGRLPHPGAERILESYYDAAVGSRVHLAFDDQWIENPAYNRDRGPVSVFALRLHAQF